MKNIKNFVKKNILFILLAAAVLLTVILRNSSFSIPIVSEPDSEIEFSTEQTVLEQTWQPNVKNIIGIRIPYVSTADFTADLRLTIYSDHYTEILASAEQQGVFRAGEEGVLELHFPKCSIVPGERLRIQFDFAAVSGEGALLIASGSRYGGCMIDGSAYKGAAAFEILSEKPSLPFKLLAIGGPFAAFSLLFMLLWNRKWEECVGLSMFAIVSLLYAAGLFDKLPAGMILVYVSAGIAFFASIYLFHKKKIQVKSLYSPALIVYGLLCVLIVLNCRGAWFARWDEYSHWGLAVKDMFFYDSFAKHVNTTVMIPRYVPFTTLIEYFFVFAEGLFSQEMVYIAYQTAMLNILIDICGIGRKRKLYLLPAAAIMVLLPVIFFGDVYNCIYVDPMLAVLMAYVLICYYTEGLRGFNLLRILGGLMALTLTKDMGMVIAGLLTAVMIADSLYHALHRKKKIAVSLLGPCGCALFVLGIYFSWQIYMGIPAKAPVSEAAAANQGITETSAESKDDAENPTMLAGIYEETASASESFTGELEADGEEALFQDAEEEMELSFQSTASAAGITLDGILGLLRHDDGGYRYQAIKNFLIMMFDGESFRFGNFGISYVDLYIVLLLLIGGLWLAGFWGNWTDKMLSFGIFTFLAGMCYSLVLELLYLFAFSMGEALMLASHERYLGSFIGGVVIAFAALLVSRAAETVPENRRRSLTVMSVLTAGIIICTPVEAFVMKNMDTQIQEEHIAGNQAIEEAFRSVSTRGESVYMVCSESRGYSYFIFKNVVSPVMTPYSEYDIYASEEDYAKQQDIRRKQGEETEGTERIISCDTWKEQLRGAQYVFLYHTGEVFKESYAELFADSSTIEDGAFYRVWQTEDGVSLELIGKVDVGLWR
ncbi:MAG: hypothetical protein HFI51_07335 [Lachnospiraceae bacterium]|nr:hypothetical protein [Lachnospiraceae bacterium]